MLGLIISAVMHKHQQTDKLASSRQKVHLIPPKRWPGAVWRLHNNEAWERNTENIIMRLLFWSLAAQLRRGRGNGGELCLCRG